MFNSVCLLLATTLACAASDTEEAVNLEPQVVTSTLPAEPLISSFDAKSAVQPIPAQDGADILRHVPGFSVIRKGGTDGDPVLRGMAGSRLTILLDGACSPGGCGQRMDPPTAYVFPSAYDRVIVQKGPQTVIYGPGITAGIVRFERDMLRFTKSGTNLDAFTSVGSFGRFDQILDARAGTPQVYGRLAGTWAQSDDYQDGNGQSVHSEYQRGSLQAAAGWTPAKQTAFELSGAISDGEAAYADRMMDGVKFARQAVSLRGQHEMTGGVLERVEGQVYYNYIDHVMDNYSLRTFKSSAMMPNRAVSNPDRLTVGGYTRANLQLMDALTGVAGLDAQYNRHRLRSAMNQDAMPYQGMGRNQDGEFTQTGLFGELAYEITQDDRLVGGARVDFWQAEDSRSKINTGMASMPNPTMGQKRDDTLGAGFLRYERSIQSISGTAYAGIGHAARFPDYWELFSKESAASLSAFNTKHERVTQFDAGLVIKNDGWTVSLATFAAWHEDFILIQSGVQKASGMGTRSATIARNCNASSMGGEFGVNYIFESGFYTGSSLAYVRGVNETDDLPLAQMPPLEGKLEAGYRSAKWSVGTLLRLVDAQDRVAVNQGNIIGQDIGTSGEFAVVSLHGAYQFTPQVEFAAGVDNLFDTTYAEHISRAGAMVNGFSQTTRVNEPGRVLWLRASLRF
ncbi:MAG: TonB-dependent copper receptor [Verrucomicrobiota bacterium]|nr:TonB-dependent copper receptor [Verrucomicrobiota bacterium]